MKCKNCPETDMTMFYPSNKSLCKVCCGARAKSRYHNLSVEEKSKYQDNVRKWQENNIFQQRYLAARSRALKRGIECSINAETLKRLYTEQEGKCFYSGMELGLKADKKYVLSVERINSMKGYTPDNIVLVCYIVNSMKNDLPLKEFISIIRNIHSSIC